jgi:carbon-monoxide dehydrogenase medium subunit
LTPAPFDHVAVRTVDEAIAALTADPGARLLAGGQSLVPLLALRAVRPTLLVDIDGLEGELGGIEPTGDDRLLRLGALVRHRVLERDPTVARAAPLLAAAARWVGHPAIRHRGTLGGSLAHADPAAELPTAVMALGGQVVVRGRAGERTVSAADLATGRFSTALGHDELVVAIVVPAAGAGHGAAFCEWAPRHCDRAEAGVGVAAERDAEGRVVSVRAAACGVADVPVALGDVLGDATRGESAVTDALVRHVAAAVAGVCRQHGAAPDGSSLAGALAARALVRAVDAAGGSPAVRAA